MVTEENYASFFSRHASIDIALEWLYLNFKLEEIKIMQQKSK